MSTEYRRAIADAVARITATTVALSGETPEELRQVIADRVADLGKASNPAACADASLDALVARFLAWPLPDEVCADSCASVQGYMNRSGTNLLNANQAKAMLQHVLGG